MTYIEISPMVVEAVNVVHTETEAFRQQEKHSYNRGILSVIALSVGREACVERKELKRQETKF